MPSSAVDARARRILMTLVLLVVWGLTTHGTFAGSGDEPHYAVIAQSIAFDGDLDVANNYAADDNLIGGRNAEAGAHARPGRDGTLRPVHDVGMPLLFAPYVAIIHPLAHTLATTVPEPLLRRAKLNATLLFRHSISLAMATLAGVLAWQLYAVFRRSGAAPRPAGAWALLLVLTPPLLSFSFVFFTELLSALLVTWLYVRLSDTRPNVDGGSLLPLRTATAAPAEDGRDRSPHATLWLAIGLAIGLLLLIHVRNVALVIGFAVWASLRLRGDGRPLASWVVFAAGVSVPLALRAWVQYLSWGTLLTSPHARADLTASVGAASREAMVRLSGLFMDQEFGLLLYAPLYLLCLPGAFLLRRAGIAGSRPLLLIVAAYLATVVIPYVNVHGWNGGWSPAARMSVPIVPLLGVAVFACGRSIGGMRRHAVSVLIAVQLVVAAVVWQEPKVLWNEADGTSALVSVLPGAPMLHRVLPSWHGVAPSALPFCVLGAAWLLLAAAVIRTARPDRS